MRPVVARVPRQHLSQEHAQRVDVTAGSELSPDAQLGRRVGGGLLRQRTLALAGLASRAQPAELHLAPATHEHVLWAEIRVQDAPVVEGGRAECDLPQEERRELG